jgi:hypothetical protein
MLLNHAGFAWLLPAQSGRGVNGALVFVGGVAPVLFFTVTGIGRGLQGDATTPHRLMHTLKRVAVLLLADAAIWLAPGSYVGLDFLGFIGLSTLVIALINRSRHPSFNAAVGVAACLALRFAVAPRLAPVSDGTAFTQVMRFALGHGTISGISYTPVPWLAYPLLGLWLGRSVAAHVDRFRASRDEYALALGAAAVLGLGACTLLSRRGLIFFRWGSMSFAYGVFSFSALFAALSICLFAEIRLSSTTIKLISLSGIASFIIVPVHYVGVAIARQLAPGIVSTAFPLAAAILILGVFALSKWVGRRVETFARRATGTIWPSVLLFAIIGLLAALAFRPASAGDAPRLALTAIAQFLSCGLFALTSRGRAREADGISRSHLRSGSRASSEGV